MRCDDADVMLMQKEKPAKSNLGKNPGALQPTPLTRDLAPRSTLPSGGKKSKVNYRIFTRHVDLLDTTNKRFLLMSMAMFFR